VRALRGWPGGGRAGVGWHSAVSSTQLYSARMRATSEVSVSQPVAARTGSKLPYSSSLDSASGLMVCTCTCGVPRAGLVTRIQALQRPPILQHSIPSKQAPQGSPSRTFW
jgi:hypothetical protein